MAPNLGPLVSDEFSHIIPSYSGDSGDQKKFGGFEREEVDNLAAALGDFEGFAFDYVFHSGSDFIFFGEKFSE
jgi:hypothetical protein